MNWLSIHFYPLETQEIFLTRALRPFLEQYIWRTRGSRAFFIRYDDERGPHIRLRMRGEPEWVAKTLRPALEGWFEGRGEWLEIPYTPETERFGGEEALGWAEEHFHLGSRVALERMSGDKRTYGDAMFDALRMHTITAQAAGLNQFQAARYFGQLAEQWLPLFYPPGESETEAFFSEIRKGFETAFTPQKEELRAALNALWKALDAANFDKKQPEWARWAVGNQIILKEFKSNLDRSLPSLLHLTNNRLGLNNQDEVYLNFILSKALA